MKIYYITFRSVTFAQRGERLLTAEGVRCTLQRTPKWMEAQGCGYCLRLRTEDVHNAVGILHRAGLPMRKIYVQRKDGNLEEMTV